MCVSQHMRGNVTSAGWQVILCDPIWHVSSRSGEASRELLYSVYFFLLTLLLQLARIRPITERRYPQLIPVLGSRPAGDASHKPGGRLPLLFTMPAVTLATLKFRCLVNRDLTGVKSLPKTKFA